ncbi:uncharacterized protein LOC118502791 isoform X1 [Anopheles stephensi]|uniref:uncharacterized protein LOC118502791 isoform X1 n=1 Tax=Anopheles stephensi TaxID=30069 RepID=UPI001658AF12|nr:uncharacterized protein LOC118502791 isoform X1 [Anopheles stephensi]
MIHILNFIAGMNNTLEGKFEGAEPGERTVTPELCFENMDQQCPHCCRSTEYSVKSLRKLFVLNHPQEAESGVKSAANSIERLPVCKCQEHGLDRMQEKKSSSEKLCETRSVQELRHMFEAKLKLIEQSSTNGSVCAYSRPVSVKSAKTDDRQDAASMDLPHPEGQIFMYNEPPVRSKPCTRWSVTNTSIVEVPNGMQITFTVLNDSKR